MQSVNYAYNFQVHLLTNETSLSLILFGYPSVITTVVGFSGLRDDTKNPADPGDLRHGILHQVVAIQQKA